MKKILLLIILMCASAIPAHATTPSGVTIYGDMVSAQQATGITDTAITHYCRAIYVGTTQSIDIYLINTGSWTTFQGAVAGEILPIQANGVRITSGAAAPNANDVVCLN